MENKSSIVIISPFLPYPLTSGGKVRILHTIQELSKQFDVTLLAFYEDEEEKNINQEWLKRQNVSSKLFKTNKRSWNSFVKHGIPYWFSSWHNKNLIDEVKSIKINQDMPQIVQIETTQLLYLVKYLSKGVKSIFSTYDVSCISFWRRLDEEKNPFKLFIKFFLWLEIFIYEKKNLSKFDTVVTVSNVDQKALMCKFNLKSVTTIQNGVKEINILPNLPKPNFIRLGFMGSFKHPPNKYAFRYFVNYIAPRLEQERIRYKFYLAGQNSEEEVSGIIDHCPLKDKSHIITMGFVEKSIEFYRIIDVLICPLISGSGTKLKVLECLSFGRCVITTTIGAEGLTINSSYLKIVHDPKNVHEWINKIEEARDILRHNLDEQNNLKACLENMTWEHIFANYMDKITCSK